MGVQPPAPEWGAIVADGRDFLLQAWCISTLPGIAIAATVITVNLVGDGIREWADPRAHERTI